MARKNPLGRITSVALGTLKDPVGTAGWAVGQARDSVTLGRHVAGQVTKGATSTASRAVGAMSQLVPGLRQDPAAPRPASPADPAGPDARLSAVPDRATPVPAEESRKVHGDPVEPGTSQRVRGDAAPGAGASSTAAKPAADKPVAKKSATKKSATKKPAAKQSAAKKSAAKKSGGRAGTKPVNVTEELGLDPAPVDKKQARAAKKQPTTRIDAAADTDTVDATPADLAKGAAKQPGSKATAKKATAGKKASPTKKAAAKKAPGAKLPPRRTAAGAKQAPLSAEELAAGAGSEVITPVGTRGADVATNPDTTDTDLQQPGTAPLMDPATTKAVASEQSRLSAAADLEKGDSAG